jgi:transposase
VSSPEKPSYEQLAALVGDLSAQLERANARIVELETRLGRDSTNSSIPPSADPIAAKAKRRADRSSRERSKDRKRGGQPGHQGSGLAPTMIPDRTETMPAPQQCSGCHGELDGSTDAGAGWAQLWDIPPVELEKVHYRLPRRRCGGCGKTTTAAAPPHAQPGAVCYGPGVNAAAILLGAEGNVAVERTAALMAALLGAPVSVGFVARAQARLAERLAAAGFDAAMGVALRAEDVLCGDETPTNVLAGNTDDDGQPLPGAPHAVTVRSTDARLVWYAPIGARSQAAITGLGVLAGYRGYLVRDDYVGWHQFDPQLAGVQQCAAHLIRHAKGVLELHPGHQRWAGEVITVLRQAATAAETARDTGHDHIDPQLLAELREAYDHAVNWGVITNRHRDWHRGHHPGYNLATRLRDKAEQVWLFTRDLAVPWTNNAAEQALRAPKRHQAVSGYWHTLTTLAADCRVRSYLTSARGHNIPAIDAIHTALAGNPWMPTPATA